MKILSLFATAIVALGLAGAASAEVAATPDALATSSFSPCAPDTADCGSLAHSDAAPTAAQSAPYQPAAKVARVEEAPLPVPELETSLMFMLGLLVLGLTSRRRSSERFDR
ncbi:hypothetical protein ASF61_01140 [Duganella sp. Leaf126]|uniref:hypothetical protein n=1 Tax=Duganella sp. Leaf126 TaxID=1736266 RepID=UPI0007149B72|nr:hypothetical protein [Duganella sp. Leaf126]KQQ47289.1 hypothetical protein ASF61_01140 [Duganella sp. Leaf126]